MPPREDQAPIAPRAIIIMGVSGSGKSTLGPLLAQTLNGRFLEGDAFHDAKNVEKMRAGQPLQDEDRWAWLDRIGAELNAAVAANGIGVAACSALKRRYRERLAGVIQAPLALVFLDADENELIRRLERRPNHYMPPSLLASQLQALEPPDPQEPAMTLDARQPVQHLCSLVCAWLSQTTPADPARDSLRQET